ncbi:hypothetical protein IEO_05579 [Bacillus wiedmannii]|nr:hypothetical protein IEO_05579 [Bacillus wiedmannii]
MLDKNQSKVVLPAWVRKGAKKRTRSEREGDGVHNFRSLSRI